MEPSERTRTVRVVLNVNDMFASLTRTNSFGHTATGTLQRADGTACHFSAMFRALITKEGEFRLLERGHQLELLSKVETGALGRSFEGAPLAALFEVVPAPPLISDEQSCRSGRANYLRIEECKFEADELA